MRIGKIVPNGICPKCDTLMMAEMHSHDIHGYCYNCHAFCGTLRDADNCCIDPIPKIVKTTIKDGRIQLKNQCENCHDIRGNAIPQKGLDLELINEVDLELYSKHLKKRETEFNNFREKNISEYSMSEKVSQLLLDSDFNYQVYKDYLQSEDWKSKRDMVLERDRHVCQACLLARANQVHHITYKHLMHEPLFELVSVCQPCHEKISMMDRGKYISSTQNQLYQNLLS